MKDKIIEYLNGLGIEGFDSNTATDEIAKIVAIHTVPKDTYNSLNTKFKNETTLREQAEADRDSYKSQADLADKNTSELDKVLKQNAELSKEMNKMQARRIFEKAGLDEDKIESLLPKVVSDDSKSTIELTTSIADMFKASKEETKKAVEDDLLKSTPKPQVKNASEENKSMTQSDFNKLSYAEKKELFLTDKETYEKFSN